MKCLKHYKTLYEKSQNLTNWGKFRSVPTRFNSPVRLLWRQRNASKIQNETRLLLFPFSWLKQSTLNKTFRICHSVARMFTKRDICFFCEQKWIWSLNIFFKKRAIKTHFLFNRQSDFSVQGNSYFLYVCLLSCSDYGKLMYDLWMTLFVLKC